MTVTISESIFINRPPYLVWDFTQDYNKRSLWDKTIREAKVIETKPRRISIVGSWGLKAELVYKLDDRPNKTSLVMTNVSSVMISGGGGSWKYIPEDSGTLWTQTNTLIFKDSFLLRLLRPLITMSLKKNTRRGMKTAKTMLGKLP